MRGIMHPILSNHKVIYNLQENVLSLLISVLILRIYISILQYDRTLGTFKKIPLPLLSGLVNNLTC